MHLVPVEDPNKTEGALPAVIEQGPTWQDMDPVEQNALVHRLLYPEWDPEYEGDTPRNYVGDLNLMRLLLRWAEQGERWFRLEAFGTAIHRRMLARLGRGHEYGDVISVESGLSVLEATDVCYALLETYGGDRPGLVVPRYGDVWRRTIEQKAQAS